MTDKICDLHDHKADDLHDPLLCNNGGNCDECAPQDVGITLNDCGVGISKSLVDVINDSLPKGFEADENIDLGPASFHIYDNDPAITEDGYGIYFTFAVGFNTDGWEVALDVAGDYLALPDGPDADASDEVLAQWAVDLVISYAARGDQSREDWAASRFETNEEV